MWRVRLNSFNMVFPAGAGVILTAGAGVGAGSCVPRRRGGDPHVIGGYGSLYLCSPQARG